jgi:hypothetical protein
MCICCTNVCVVVCHCNLFVDDVTKTMWLGRSKPVILAEGDTTDLCSQCVLDLHATGTPMHHLEMVHLPEAHQLDQVFDYAQVQYT